MYWLLALWVSTMLPSVIMYFGYMDGVPFKEYNHLDKTAFLIAFFFPPLFLLAVVVDDTAEKFKDE